MSMVGRENPTIERIYEDNHVLVVVKPAGIPSQADRSGCPDMLTLLKDDIKVRYGKPGAVWLGLVHRLDRPVCGLMVFARTSKAAARLSEQIRTRRIERGYLAVCRGHVEPVQGTWEDYLGPKTKNGNVTVTSKNKGKAAWLAYRVLNQVTMPAPLSLLEINLITGRSHQIRVQSSSRGWPLVGDRRYGIMDEFDRQHSAPALFANRLAFDHPTTRERLVFCLPLPEQEPFRYFQ